MYININDVILEGGQSSTGSVLSWARRLFGRSALNKDEFISYKELDDEVY